MASTPEQDAWLHQALGLDPGGYGGDGDAAGALGPDSAGRGGMLGALAEKVGLKTPSTTPKPPKPPAPAKLELTSKTEAKSPTDRTRTKLGVGERVTLSISAGPGTWTVKGGTLSATTGSKVTLTAGDKAGKIEVSVAAAGQTKKLSFTVITPSIVHQDVISTEHLSNGLPNAGFHGQIYIGPDTVSFAAVSFTEGEIGAKASGSWKAKNGEGHSPNPAPLPCSATVVSGKGTKASAVDHCWTGYVPGLTLKDWTGEMSWTIPWYYHIGSTKGSIGNAVQRVITKKDGTTTISKAGATATFALS